MDMSPISCDWASFSLTTGQSDYNVKINVAALLNLTQLSYLRLLCRRGKTSSNVKEK